MVRKFLFILSLIFLTACGSTRELWQQTVYDVPSGSILFKEDFSDDQNGWRTWNEKGSIVTYQAEGLRFYINQSNFDYISTPGYTFKNSKATVNTIKVGGPNDNAFGLICRYHDAQNYYAFLISSDGYAGILRVLEGEYTLLNADTLEYSAVINQGEALNTLTAECNGQTLALAVNDQVLFQVKDEYFEVGDVGLMVSSYEEPGVDLLFDNLTVLQP